MRRKKADYIPYKLVLFDMIVPSHIIWLSEFKWNKILNSTPQLHYPHVKCSAARFEQGRYGTFLSYQRILYWACSLRCIWRHLVYKRERGERKEEEDRWELATAHMLTMFLTLKFSKGARSGSTPLSSWRTICWRIRSRSCHCWK